MILAAILLKLGGYGILRLIKFNLINFKILFFWVLLRLLFIGFICFRQNDIKSLIAYSSISHMGLIVFLLFLKKRISFFSIFLILIGHGFIRRALFQTFKFVYLKSNSRKVIFNKAKGKASIFFFLFFLFVA
jgi:NADH:ubiquinone oxidoreductase subunit 4 (subunit M)